MKRKGDMTIEYVSQSEIAARLGVTVSRVSQLRQRGELPEPDAIIYGRWGWHPATLERWYKKRGV